METEKAIGTEYDLNDIKESVISKIIDNIVLLSSAEKIRIVQGLDMVGMLCIEWLITFVSLHRFQMSILF